MDYVLRGHEFCHEVYTIIQLFFPNGKYVRREAPDPARPAAESGISGNMCYAELTPSGIRREADISGMDEREIKNAVKTTVFACLTELTGKTMPWGILTGVRPTKKVFELFGKGLSVASVKEIFEREYLVSRKKAALCLETARNERKILETASEELVSLYIGIPFCPTRCLYCSFAAYPIEKYRGRTGEYLGCLERELALIAEITRQKGQRLQSVYVGGGTPAVLSAGEIGRLMSAVSGSFGAAALREFSFEAGRPDAIDGEKLAVLRERGATRISVNPQTLSAATLERIGRKHTPEDFFRAFESARAAGFDNINVDVILGLPGETTADAERTLSGVIALAPDSVTAHVLTVKRAADLRENLSDYELTSAETAAEMTDLSYDLCKAAGLKPYYLYRQKNSLGNLENTGYARHGAECFYNVQITEERQTVYAAGAGAVTKVYFPAENRLERVFNVKNVDEYMARINEMLKRKEELL